MSTSPALRPAPARPGAVKVSPALVFLLPALLLPGAALPSSDEDDHDPVGLAVVYATPDETRAMAEARVPVAERLGMGEFLVPTNPETLALMAALGIDWTAVTRDAYEWYGERALTSSKAYNFPTWTAVRDEIVALTDAEPDLTRLEVLGTTSGGRPILAVRVGTDFGTDTLKPSVQLIGSIHGDEKMGTEICMRALRMFINEYGVDPEVTELVDELDIFIVPVMNPDGYATSRRHNGRNVDLNRNYGFMWEETFGSGTGPFSEVETRAMDALAHRERFVLSLAYHTAAAYVNYPWNHTRRPTPDDTLILGLSREYGTHSGYTPINGWSWYPITGDADDYLYGTHGGINVTVETDDDRPDRVWEKNRDALIAYIANARAGVHGRVTDFEGRPLAASVWIEEGGWPVFTRPGRGDFHRLLAPGTYHMRVAANGYQPVVVPVVVEEGGRTILEVTLSNEDRVYGKSLAGIEFRPCHDTTVLLKTEPFDMLGAPDGVGFPLCSQGAVVIDLGPDSLMVDGDGPDLLIHGEGGDGTSYEVFVASDSHHGPWTSVGSYTGEAAIDVATAGQDPVRFVRIRDASSLLSDRGLVLDGIEVLNFVLFRSPDEDPGDPGDDPGGQDPHDPGDDPGDEPDDPAEDTGDEDDDEVDPPGGGAGIGCGCSTAEGAFSGKSGILCFMAIAAAGVLRSRSGSERRLRR